MNLPKTILRIALLAALVPASRADDESASLWQSLLVPSLNQNSREQHAARRELEALGDPVAGQTVPQFGFQMPRYAAPPVSAPWIQIDLGASRPIDWIALIPAQLDWQSTEQKSHAFPLRFRVDVSDDPAFDTFTPVAVLTDEDYPDPGLAPVGFRIERTAARYARVTVTKLPIENGQYFFALAEIMVLSGPRNIAIGSQVSASAKAEIPPRWSLANLVDGRTPFGPPIQRDLLPYDGAFTGPHEVGERSWMRLDLGRRAPLQEIRLHPIHARLGADVPGYAFPARFRIEAGDDPAFAETRVIFDSSREDFSNPGNNPVTLPAGGIEARYLQITLITPAIGLVPRRFGFSEIEVFSDDLNLARDAVVTTAPDKWSRKIPRPVNLLIDGYASYGRLLDLPDWLANWQERSALQTRLGELAQERAALEAVARGRAAWIGIGLLFAVSGSLGLYLYSVRRSRGRELERFRTRLAHDLHDEIGSNLAGLGVLSEYAADHATPTEREDWLEVTRISRETSDVMREVLWLVGARQEMGIDLDAHLRLAAKRMLPHQTVRWLVEESRSLSHLPTEIRRQVFLFFKESLTNIVRHARSTTVEIALRDRGGHFELAIADNGVGFDPANASRGVGLSSLRERARAIGGNCRIDSEPGNGTTVTLRVPNPSSLSTP